MMLEDLDEVEVQKSGYVMIVTTIIHWLESPFGFNGFVCSVSEQSQYLSQHFNSISIYIYVYCS